MPYVCNKPSSRFPPSRLPFHSSRLCRWLALALSVVTCPVAGRDAEDPHPNPPAGVTEVFQADSLTLSSPSRTPLEADGELIGHLPATFSLQRSRLRVIVP